MKISNKFKKKHTFRTSYVAKVKSCFGRILFPVRHAKNPRALVVEIFIDDISATLRATNLRFLLHIIICAGLMHLILRIF
jgi:hypothetical protein